MNCFIDGTVDEEFLSLGVWGIPVIAYPIKSALESGVFDQVIVVTESSYIDYLVREFFGVKIKLTKQMPMIGIRIDGRAANIMPETIRKIANLVDLKELKKINIMQFVQNPEELVLVDCSNNFELTLVLWRKRNKNVWLKKMIINRINDKQSIFLNPIKKKEICLIGHSQWDQWNITSLHGYSVRNCGISGITIKEYINEILKKNCINLSSGIILVLIGINDLEKSTNICELVNGMIDLLELIHNKTDAHIYVVQTLHIKGRIDRNNTIISQYNKKLHKSLPNYAKWINTAEMNDSFGNLDYHFTTDGLHLNGAGYKKLYDILDCALEECDGDGL